LPALDLPGQLLAIAGPGLLTVALVEAGRLGWSAPLVLAGWPGYVLPAAGTAGRVRRHPAFVMPPAEPVDISARAAGSFGTRRPFGEMAAVGG
jgi:hypothetical protein